MKQLKKIKVFQETIEEK